MGATVLTNDSRVVSQFQFLVIPSAVLSACPPL